VCERRVAEQLIPVGRTDQLLQFSRIHAGRERPSDESADAGSGDQINRNTVLLEPANHTDMREPARAPATESHADAWSPGRCSDARRPGGTTG
jgi:hypothetical protein